MSNALDYVSAKQLLFKLTYSKDGQEIILRNCPFCHDNNYHLYLNDTTEVYYCHKCQAGGTLLTLKEKLGDLMKPVSFEDLDKEKEVSPITYEHIQQVEDAHKHLLQDKETLWYLSSRRWTLEAVQYFKLGLSDEDGIKWLYYPIFSNGNLKNVKMRTLPPAERGFRRLFGGESLLFNEDILQEDHEYIIICEGEADAISVWSKGFKNVIGTTLGARGIKPEWIEQLDRFKKIIFVYDSDDPGQIGAQQFAARLGLERCRNILLPNGYKDINEYFIAGKTAADFQKLIDNADTFDVENVQSLSKLIQHTIRQLNVDGATNRLELPWKNVNRLINGFDPGDLIVLAAKPKVGKSSFAFNLLYYFATHDVPSLLFSLEMAIWRILPRLIALHKRRDSRECNSAVLLAESYKELKDVPLYFAHKYMKPNWNFVADTVRSSVKHYGIRFMVFDNLHFLCRSLTKQTEEVSVMSQNFKLLAEELAIPILLIARPRKTHAKIISGEDLKDSADIEGDLDILMTLSRDRKKSMSGEEIEGAFEAQTLVDIPACRYAPGGSTYLYANDAECRFDEI